MLLKIDFVIIRTLILTFISFVIAILLTPAVTHYLYKYKLGKRIRSSDQTPIFTKLHAQKEGTPTMGGVLIWGTVVIVTLLLALLADAFPWLSTLQKFNFLSRSETLLPLGILVVSAIVGLVDDLFNVRRIGPQGGGLRVRHKLLLYLLIAIFGAYWFYSKLGWTTLHVPFVGSFDIGLWYIPIFIFMIAATAFSVNEIDGLDGLAGGTLLPAFVAYAGIAFAQGKYDLVTFCGVIIGALLAFLWFNVNPARFFMGDTGSMSLGVTLGIIAMLTNASLLLPVIGFVFAVVSLSVVIQLLWRMVFKKKVFLSAPIHHHLEAKGWSEPKIVMRFWIIAGVTALLGLVLAIIDKR